MNNYFSKQNTEQMRLLVSIIKQLYFCFPTFSSNAFYGTNYSASPGESFYLFSLFLLSMCLAPPDHVGSRRDLLSKSCHQSSLVLADGKWQVVGSSQTSPQTELSPQRFLHMWMVNLQLLILGDIHQPLQMGLFNLFSSCSG